MLIKKVHGKLKDNIYYIFSLIFMKKKYVNAYIFSKCYFKANPFFYKQKRLILIYRMTKEEFQEGQ